MKLSKLLAASAAMLAFASPSFADVTLRCTGSTAFRAAANQAFRDMLTSPIYKYSGANLGASANVFFQGTIAGQPSLGTVTIKCTWSGSTDGINQLANGLTGTKYYVNSTGATSGGATDATNITETGNAPDLILMDTTQGQTPYQANPITEDQIIGVLPFVWVASKDAPAGLTNMTAQAARQMFSTGYLSASAFTGNAADSPVDAAGNTNATGSTIFMAGRDNGSGTRTSALSESAYGALNLVLQVQPTGSLRVNTTNASTTLAIIAADQTSVSTNMVGKPITGTGIPASTTITAVTASTLTISNAATAAGSGIVTTIGNTTGNIATALYITPDGGNGGQSSGGNLADQLRLTTNGASDPLNLQTNSLYSNKVSLVGYLGLADADRAVAGTSSGISVGTNVGCRYLSYEGVSVTGGVRAALTITSQGAGVTTLTVGSGSTTGIVAGQLVGGNGIAPGTTIVSTTATTITLSTATTNASALSNNVVTATQFLPATVRSGAYSFWSYERIGYRSLNADKTAVKDKFFLQATSSSIDLGSVGGLPDDTEMRVSRSDVGSPIALKF